MRRAFIHANVIDVLHKRILENYSVIVGFFCFFFPPHISTVMYMLGWSL